MRYGGGGKRLKICSSSHFSLIRLDDASTCNDENIKVKFYIMLDVMFTFAAAGFFLQHDLSTIAELNVVCVIFGSLFARCIITTSRRER